MAREIHWAYKEVVAPELVILVSAFDWLIQSSALPHPGAGAFQARVDWLAFQGQHREGALVDPMLRLTLNERLPSLQVRREFR